jgi:hypothetical protein
MRASVLMVVVSCTAACSAPPGPLLPAGPAATTGASAATPEPAGTLRGTLRGPAGLIAAGGLNLASVGGQSLISNAPPSLIAAGGLNLRAPTFGLAATASGPVADVVVGAARPDGSLIEPFVLTRTDQAGRFGLVPPAGAGLLVALAEGPNRRLVKLFGLGRATEPGGAAAITPASTLVATALRRELPPEPVALSAIAVADWRIAVQGVAGAADGLSAEALGNEAQLLQLFLAVSGGAPAVREAFARMRDALKRPVSSARPSAAPSQVAGPAPEVTRLQLKAGLAASGGCFEATDAGLELAPGDRLDVAASGQVSWGASSGLFGPAGDPNKAPEQPGCPGAPLPGQPVGALVMRVGDGPWELVGAGKADLTGRRGRLRFALNDTRADDNGGTLDITVTIRRAPR